ncbi:Hypothetical predicted protein [Cloeon dipterum]|uniref:DUF4806 domain-containing protein n=1 Tax=Cloeon dipterum TaxID=197152 RepID=A0A8S1D416_9INSE|nr:Hypothetical predicted protein [Cloeon dipterum]
MDLGHNRKDVEKRSKQTRREIARVLEKLDRESGGESSAYDGSPRSPSFAEKNIDEDPVNGGEIPENLEEVQSASESSSEESFDEEQLQRSDDSEEQQQSVFDIEDEEEEDSGVGQPMDTQTPTILSQIVNWALKFLVSLVALRALLFILRQHPCFAEFPKDPRTLLKSPRRTKVESIPPGEYIHLGIGEGLKNIFSCTLCDIDTINIDIGIDGVPLAKSGGHDSYPICAAVKVRENEYVYTVGLYHGEEKPNSSNAFLKPMIDEALQLHEHGLEINGKIRMMFSVVHFPASKTVDAVPSHWIKNGKVPWPETGMSKATLKRIAESKAAPNKTYELFTVENISATNDLEQADRRANKAQYTRDVSTTEIDSTLEDEDSESDVEEEVENRNQLTSSDSDGSQHSYNLKSKKSTQKGKENKGKEITQAEAVEYLETRSSKTRQKTKISNGSRNISDEFDTRNDKLESISKRSQTTLRMASTEKRRSPSLKDTDLDEVFVNRKKCKCGDKTNALLVEVLERQIRMEQRQKQILKSLQSRANNASQSSSDATEKKPGANEIYLKFFPLKSHQEKEEIESKLKNDQEFRKAVITSMSQRCGHDTEKKAVEAIMKSSLDKDFASQFTRDGTKSKEAFRELELYKIMKQAILDCKTLKVEPTEAEVDKYLSRWLTIQSNVRKSETSPDSSKS